MKFETTEVTCKDCGKKFLVPCLGDFSYGSFIFSGESGSVFGCFQALDNPAWNFIETVINNRVAGDRAACEHGERLQTACAYFADAIEGQRLRNHEVCPRCHSDKIHFESCGRVGVIEIPDVSHVGFLAMPESVRRQKVLEFDHQKPNCESR
jgi:hypothetical protein